jgi:hypothetical protein
VRVDRQAPVWFLQTAYEPEDWVGVFLKSYATGRVVQRVGSIARIADVRFQAWLRAENATGANVYISVNAVAPGQRSRRRDAIRTIRHVFVDADHDAQDVLRAIAARSDVPPPSYVLPSSPRRAHVLWRATGFTTDGVEALQKHLARQLGTDPAATPCTQTTRLPGFFNHKYTSPYLVLVEYRDSHGVYSPADFPTRVQTPTPARPIALVVAIDALERARRYAAAIPPAITGQHGDVHTFRVCCRLARGFALSDDQAFTVLCEWNARCQPPWSDRELMSKLERARRYGREPIGGLLEGQP